MLNLVWNYVVCGLWFLFKFLSLGEILAALDKLSAYYSVTEKIKTYLKEN